jgi:hypothetical protein
MTLKSRAKHAREVLLGFARHVVKLPWRKVLELQRRSSVHTHPLRGNADLISLLTSILWPIVALLL